LSGREIIFEFHRIGAYVKVTAMDVATQEEVTITGDALATKEYLQKLARDKLARMLEKKGLLK
jgi:hypothetical protein